MNQITRSNCLVWAIAQWWREGGYIAVRSSKHWRFLPHFMWSKDLKVWLGFVPRNPKLGPLATLFCWWFTGSAEQEQC